MKRTLVASLVIAVSILIPTPRPTLAAQTLAGACDVGQYLDNTWVVRNAVTGASGPWTTSASGLDLKIRVQPLHWHPAAVGYCLGSVARDRGPWRR